jgi:hypothetical protein
MSYDLPTCPTGCAGAPAEVEFDNCNPELHSGPLEYLYLRQRGQPFTDWTSGAEWAANIDNAGSAATDIRQLRIIGEWPEPESNEKIISGNRRYLGVKTFVVNFEIDETNDTNYEFLRSNECSGNYSVWLESSNSSGVAGKLYGDNDGIEAFVKLNLVIARDENEHDRFMGTITWQSQFHPKRITSPIAH